jgi:hypothetical protein
LTNRACTFAAVVLCAAAGCDLPAKPGRPKLLTFADLETLADTADAKTIIPGTEAVPGGLRLRDYITKDGGGYRPTLRNTWTETYRSAYVTAELWTGFDEVWVQPVYVPITGFANGVPVKVPGEKGLPWSPIFSVGPGSAFYSPFWQVFYFVVSPDTDPETLRTARKIIDLGVPLIEGPAHVMSLVPPDGVELTQTVTDVTQHVGGPTSVSKGYLDGADASFLDFGTGTFSSNEDRVVEETPLFVLVYRDESGALQKMNVPTVAGTGPLYSNRLPNVRDNVPHYGAYWRLYTVEVPATARIFAPPTFPDERADYPPALIGDGMYGADVLDATNKPKYEYFLGRVALNALPVDPANPLSGCFGSLTLIDTRASVMPLPCQWLDSQAALEAAVPPTAIHRTDILVTCPFVSYHDQAVVP